MLNKMNYKTHKIIQRVGCDTFWLSNLLCFIPFDNSILIPMNILRTSSFLVYIYTMNNKKIFKFEEIKDLNELYHEFIKNYAKLNKIFDFNNPMEVYSMYLYMVKKGYLSADKKFIIEDDKKHKDIPYMYGLNIIDGKGVCRHLSSMLTDIYKELDIESYILTCYLKNPYVKEIPFYPIGNHAITFVHHDGINYYVDPTLNEIYNYDVKHNEIIGKANVAVVKISNMPDINIDVNKKKISEYISKYDDLSEEQNAAYVSRSKKLLQNNQDILEDFYIDNKELLKEINHKYKVLV